MKTDTHPQVNPVVFIDSSTKKEFVTTSTLTSEKNKKINGVDHYVISIEISSDSHPFYTGKAKLIDTAGRVERFKAKRAAAAKNVKEKPETQETKKEVTPKNQVEKEILDKEPIIEEKLKEDTADKAA